MAVENTLFDADDFIDKKKLKAQQEIDNPSNLPLLLISKKANKKLETPLEKESIRYNKLLKEINDFEATLKNQKEKQQEQASLYRKKCIPEMILLAEVKLQFLLMAEKIFEQSFFRKKEKQEFCEFVQLFAQDVIEVQEEIAIFSDKYFNLSLTLLSNKQIKKIKKEITEDFEGEIEFEEDDFDKGNFAKNASEKINDFYKNKIEQEKHHEDITSISIAELYKALAKQLHPDLEKDDTTREIKVKLMQELSEAKINKDLFAMLRIQQKAAAYLHADITQKIFSIEKLKAYNKVLADKIKKYKMQLGQSILNDYYKDKNGFLQSKKPNDFEKMLDKQVKQIKNIRNQLKKDFSIVRTAEDLEVYMMYYNL